MLHFSFYKILYIEYEQLANEIPLVSSFFEECDGVNCSHDGGMVLGLILILNCCCHHCSGAVVVVLLIQVLSTTTVPHPTNNTSLSHNSTHG